MTRKGDTTLIVHPLGHLINATGAAVTTADVSIVQGELRDVGAHDLAAAVSNWWFSTPH